MVMKWLWNDAQSLKYHRWDNLYFGRSSKFQGHTSQKMWRFECNISKLTIESLWFALFVPCDVEIRRMTLKNNRAPPLCYLKLCASFRSHLWIQTGVTVRKRPKWGKICFDLCDIDLWPLTLNFCMDITFVNGNNSWKSHDDAMTATLWKGCHSWTDGKRCYWADWSQLKLLTLKVWINWTSNPQLQYPFIYRILHHFKTYLYIGRYGTGALCNLLNRSTDSFVCFGLRFVKWLWNFEALCEWIWIFQG